ncbi:MAG: cytotoxic translational repressor of toxin-antitoxin stability system [Deltaproteobacteria bacterium]|jgi:mRNA-degrading endonuclease RelE of RelBE toxin-antitoxin system|nr:cytotoxic translational repressor of toxin-antitoxin stability system [Deltaproteobacteria bacterium]
MDTKEVWTVGINGRAKKSGESLPQEIRLAFMALFKALATDGPVQQNRRHYGKLAGRPNTYHCHLNGGRPTYVVIWKVLDKQKKIMEIQYVGTHENAPY